MSIFSNVNYLHTAANLEQLPPEGPPEIAFAGRSNAGKSSAINALAGQRRLAFFSKTPGRTQQINFFALKDGGLLTDLPGYGYATAPKEEIMKWSQGIDDYLNQNIIEKYGIVNYSVVEKLKEDFFAGRN
jgi:GTP-binding protein